MTDFRLFQPMSTAMKASAKLAAKFRFEPGSPSGRCGAHCGASHYSAN